jgi:hypothetical protein
MKVIYFLSLHTEEMGDRFDKIADADDVLQGERRRIRPGQCLCALYETWPPGILNSQTARRPNASMS